MTVVSVLIVLSNFKDKNKQYTKINITLLYKEFKLANIS